MASRPSIARRMSSSPLQQTTPEIIEPPLASTGGERSAPMELNPTTFEEPVATSNSPPAVPQPTDREPRECWICRQDDTDDTPENSEWRSPCPCSMQAHESCLLEWITDKEAPIPGVLASPAEILCPVCKHPYQIDRPKDYIVIVTDKIQRAGKLMIIPAALGAVAGTVFSGLLVYGINTLQMVFGPQHAAYIMGLSMRHTAIGSFSELTMRTITAMDPFLPLSRTHNVMLFIGLPLIAPVLVLSRIRIADPLLGILPVTYFMFRPENRDLRHWPPSPALTVAVLPYVRSAYNEIYRLTFGDLEKKWDQAVQRPPREGETVEVMGANQAVDAEEEGGIFDFQLQFINEEIEEIPGGQMNMPEGFQNGGQQQAGAGQDAIPNQPAQAAGQQAAQPQPAVQRRNQGGWEMRQNISTVQVASRVMGALFLPAISSLMGDLLKYTLPIRWVSKTTVRVSAPGMLQQKWGRSIVGGCLFVVLKDVVILYCKWKKARDFGKRKVVDYVRKQK